MMLKNLLKIQAPLVLKVCLLLAIELMDQFPHRELVTPIAQAKLKEAK